MLLNSLKERRKAAFTQNAQRMKRVFDNLQHKIDEVISAVANVPHSLSIIFCMGKNKCMLKEISSFYGLVKKKLGGTFPFLLPA